MSLDAARDRLNALARRDAAGSILERFAAEPDRLDRLTLKAGPLFLDLSKQTFSLEGLKAGLDLARSADVEGARARMLAGEAVNTSEGRAVLHMALRSGDGADFKALGQPISADVEAARGARVRLDEAIRNGPFNAVVHIGIGGSDLGPRMVWEVVRSPSDHVERRFVSNMDEDDLDEALADLDPERTVVVIVSKTFTTLETMANAERARDWLSTRVSAASLGDHLVGVTAAPAAARTFGCGHVLEFADWVGGRFSLWSGVSLSLLIGRSGLDRLLAGAQDMDAHFLDAPLERNAPVLMALAEVFNVSAGRHARCIAPYSHRLRLLPAFLQQLEMESNGKRVGMDGNSVKGSTCPVVFGQAGTNAQHAFFQLLHQGTEVIPTDFVVIETGAEGRRSQAAINANALAQAEALMVGKTEAAARAELIAAGASEAQADILGPQKAFPGNRPSTMVVAPRLDLHTLGALIALYEHKTFVEGVIWGINSFDQWGVELGKVLAKTIDVELKGGEPKAHDPSTAALIARLRS